MAENFHNIIQSQFEIQKIDDVIHTLFQKIYLIKFIYEKEKETKKHEPKSKTVIPKVCFADQWWPTRLAQVVHQYI